LANVFITPAQEVARRRSSSAAKASQFIRNAQGTRGAFWRGLQAHWQALKHCAKHLAKRFATATARIANAKARIKLRARHVTVKTLVQRIRKLAVAHVIVFRVLLAERAQVH
jgi:hypothetical protein